MRIGPCALAPAIVAAALVRPAAATADDVSATRYSLEERAHTVDVRIDRGSAVLVVRRTIENLGPRSDQATFHLHLPEGAVATGLRSLGAMKNGDHVWFDGELMEAEAAARKYRELTGIGGYYPKDPALLSWRSHGYLALQVFPVPARGFKTVEYTLRMPTQYHHGRYHVALPALGSRATAVKISVRAANVRDAVFVDDARVAAGATFDATTALDIAIEPHEPPLAALTLGVVPFAAKRTLVRSRVEISRRLSEVPRGAYVVVVADTSRSMTDDDVAAELAAARASLSHFPDAKVELITFDRTAHRRHGGFVPVATARADLATLRPLRKNGSHLDAALADADILLATAPGGAPRRIIVTSDLRTRVALTPESVRAKVATSGAIVHFAAMTSGAPHLSRDDDATWAQAPRATGGIYWRASASPDASQSALMNAVYEEWARPLRIDRAKLTAGALGSDELSAPTSFAEGEGFDDTRIVAAGPSSFELRGELWSQPVHAVAAPSATEAKAWSALVFGSSVWSELTEPEMMVLAMRGGAVSPVTSYLAIEPGVRPSTEGLEWGSGSGSGFGRGCGWHFTRAPHMRMMDTFDYVAVLREELARGLVACGGRGTAMSVGVETTSREIVEVTATVRGQRDARLERCVAEVGWTIDLPTDFESQHHSNWRVDL